jgi:D-alanyl-D-alanine carboxypeptidase
MQAVKLGQPRAAIGAISRTLVFAAIFAGLALVGGSTSAMARGHHHGGRARMPVPAGATDPGKDAALIADGETGRILYARNANAERHPASLTKMMTLYLLFESLKRGDVTMQTMLPISEHAAAQRPTNLHLYAGDSISVDTAIKAIVVRSANDVAVAIAEALGGTEGHFAELMTQKARALGMRDTFYHNASGLPDELQITTASDLLVLARHLAYDFPQYFPYFATPGFVFRGATYVTHDNLIGRYDGADGIKTGYTSSSGFNLVSSVVRNNAHVIGVVMGGRTAHRRDLEMVRLLDTAFAQIQVNPSLVARNGVPWRNVLAATSATPLVASLDAAPSVGDDEDAAESARPDEGDADSNNVIAAPPPPRPNVIAQSLPPAQPQMSIVPTPNYVPLDAYPPPPAQTAPARAANVPAQPRTAYVPPPVQPTARPQAPAKMANVPRPEPKPFQAVATATNLAAVKPKPQQLAMLTPAVKPTARPHQRTDNGEGDIGDGSVAAATTTPAAAAAMGPHAWTIQIGAFADMNQARGQLAAYAEKSMDILGQAARIIIPFTGVDGHTLYRARFGPFVEREAREVCSRLTERGQTCFTVLASSH